MLSIRHGVSSDASVLTPIARAAKAHWGYPSDWLERWRAELTLAETDLSRFMVFVAERDGAPVGFCALAPAEREWTLEHLWVRPEAMGQGVGRLLFERALDNLRDVGAASLRIVSDPNAVGFYARLGAERIGEQDGSIAGVSRVLPVLRVVL